MSVSNFTPEIWSPVLLAAERRDLVFGNLFNRDYEGSISEVGDTVRINAIGDITISSYSKDTTISAPQTLVGAQSVLQITQGKYFNFAVDDVDMAQNNPKVMAEAMSYAAYKLALTKDQYLAGFYSDTISGNILGTTSGLVISAPTAANAGVGTTAYDYLVQLSQLLTQNDVPRAGRWCVIPAWFKTYLTMDVRFTSFNTAEARQTITTGMLDVSMGNAADAYLGKVENMDVYESNNAPHISGTVGAANSIDVVLCAHRSAYTMADNLNKMEAFRPPDRFADAVKGLALYGAKTVRPYASAFLYAKHP